MPRDRSAAIFCRVIASDRLPVSSTRIASDPRSSLSLNARRRRLARTLSTPFALLSQSTPVVRTACASWVSLTCAARATWTTSPSAATDAPTAAPLKNRPRLAPKSAFCWIAPAAAVTFCFAAARPASSLVSLVLSSMTAEPSRKLMWPRRSRSPRAQSRSVGGGPAAAG